MTSWIPYVFVRIVIFFIGGVVLGIYYPDSISLSIASMIGIILGSLYLIVFVLSRLLKFKSGLPGLIALLTIFISGYICLLVNDQLRNPDHLTSFNNIKS